MGDHFEVKKPLIDESLRAKDDEGIPNIKTFSGISWPSSSWQDGSRRSAFQPYKPTTILTNLQRGNIQTNTPQLDQAEVTWFEKAGRGDITLHDIKNVADINSTDKDGLTALMWSSAYGQLAAVQILLQSGAGIQIQGKHFETALHLAAAGGHHDVISLLLSSGADVNSTDSEGNTPLIYAVYGDHPHSVNELLLGGADVTVTNIYDQNPFSVAVDMDCIQAQIVLEYHLISLLIP